MVVKEIQQEKEKQPVAEIKAGCVIQICQGSMEGCEQYDNAWACKLDGLTTDPYDSDDESEQNALILLNSESIYVFLLTIRQLVILTNTKNNTCDHETVQSTAHNF